MTVKTGSFATFAVLAALVVSGCGGSDAPSKDEYIAQTDQICLEGDKALNAAIKEQITDQKLNDESITAFSQDVMIPNIEAQLVDLRDLTPPEGEEETLTSIYDTLEVAVTKMGEDPLSAVRKPPEELKEASRMAREFGMTECGSD